MVKKVKISSLVMGTTFEILSAAIIYAGIAEVEKGNDTVGITLVCIGATMFIIGFATLQWRGSAKKNKKAGEDLRVQLDIENILDMIPDELKNSINPHLNDILEGVGTSLEELTSQGKGNLK